LGINEEDRVLIKLADNKVILKSISDPLSLVLKVKKWAETTDEEFEEESEEEQDEFYGS